MSAAHNEGRPMFRMLPSAVVLGTAIAAALPAAPAAAFDPDDDSTDLTTPEGVGNVAGAAVVEARTHDGMNQLGNGNGRTTVLARYEDTTGYRPKNSAYELEDPSHWQPRMFSPKQGLF